MSKTILLTGATGFLGSHLLEALIKEKYNVIILKRSFSNTWRIQHLLDNIMSYDIDKIDLKQVFEENEIYYVIHLATYYKKSHSYNDVPKMIESNIYFPSLLLELMKQYSINYFINTGTFFEYSLNKRLIDENTNKNPYNLYASTKIAFTEILKYYSKNHNIKSIDLKLFAPYGPKDNENKLMVSLIKSFINKELIEVSPGEQRWSWTYYKDIIIAYLKSLKYITQMKENYAVFNIGYDKAYSIREIVQTLEEITGIKNVVKYTKPYAYNELFYVLCDNTKSKNLLKWLPKYDLKSGLRDMYNYYMKGEINE